MCRVFAAMFLSTDEVCVYPVGDTEHSTRHGAPSDWHTCSRSSITVWRGGSLGSVFEKEQYHNIGQEQKRAAGGQRCPHLGMKHDSE